MKDVLGGFLAEFREKPFDKITVSGICRRAGVARGSFYRRYHSTSQCLEAVVDRYLRQSCREAEREGLQAYFSFWEQHREFLQLMKTNGLYIVLVDRATELLSAGKPEGWNVYRVRFVVSGTFCVILRWVEDGCVKSPAAMERALQRIYVTAPKEILPCVK